MNKAAAFNILKYVYMFCVGLVAVTIFDALGIDDEYFGVDFSFPHYVLVSLASVFGVYFFTSSGGDKDKADDVDAFLNKK